MSKVDLTLRWLVVPLSFIAFNPATMAASFPGAGIDTTASLGQFTLRLTKQTGNMLGISGCPMNPACLITSPVLYDPHTEICRSDPISDNDNNPPGTDSAMVCGKKVKDKQLIFPVGSSLFSEGPVNTAEVHTEITSLNMTGGGYTVRLNKNKRSRGEVESKSDGNPNGGFPAESFFNVYVEVDVIVPGLGKKTLFNKYPLIIQNGNLLSFPPTVVYVHGASNAVAVYDKDNPNGPPIAGLVLAGHGLQPKLTGRELCADGAAGVSATDGCVTQKEIDDIGADIFGDLGPEMPFPLSVKLKSLTTTVQDGEVTINFETASEPDTLDLQLWRGEPINGECTADLLNYINLNMVDKTAAVGSETTGASYKMADSVAAGTYCYALKEVNENGDAVWIESHLAKAVVN
jgi:hypothetical protein